MRNIAYGILMVVFLSILIVPLGEMVNVMREKILIGSAISNASRVAKDQSLEYSSLRDLDATVNQEEFKQFFAEAFEKALNLTLTSTAGNTLTFSSNDGKYHAFTVSLHFVEKMDRYTEQMTTEVKVKANVKYKFKTKYLKIAEDAYKDVDYELVEERLLILSIKN